MRTTLAIDDDVFLLAREQAQRERISIGTAVSRLAREGLRAGNAPRAAVEQPVSKYALLPKRAEIITTQHVRQLMDQEGV